MTQHDDKRTSKTSRLASGVLLAVLLAMALVKLIDDRRPSAVQSPAFEPVVAGTSTWRSVPTSSTLPSSAAVVEVSDVVFLSPTGDDNNSGRDPGSAVLSPAVAVSLLQPGDTLEVAAGLYERLELIDKHNIMIRTAPGLAPGSSTFSDGQYDRHAAIWIENSTGITIDGIHATNSLWGIHVVASRDIEIRNSLVDDIGQEAVHFREGSSGIRIVNNEIAFTGQRRTGPYTDFEYRKRGEGIYLGTGNKVGDVVHDVLIDGNHIHHTTGEAIDIKPAVTDVTIRSNTIHDIDTHVAAAIVVWAERRKHPAPSVTIEQNVIYRVTEQTGKTDGNAIRLSAAATVRHNIIWDVEDHGVLADGDFVSPDGNLVVIENNIIASSGEDPIGLWDSPNPADAIVTNNRSGPSITELLGDDLVDANGLPTQALRSALAQLLTAKPPAEPAGTFETTLVPVEEATAGAEAIESTIGPSGSGQEQGPSIPTKESNAPTPTGQQSATDANASSTTTEKSMHSARTVAPATPEAVEESSIQPANTDALDAPDSLGYVDLEEVATAELTSNQSSGDSRGAPMIAGGRNKRIAVGGVLLASSAAIASWGRRRSTLGL